MRAAATLTLLLLLCPPAQAAKQSSTPNRYGAIAFHRASQAWGIAYDQARARDAEITALKQCGHRECVIVHKFRNGCAALFSGPKAFAASSGATREEAETKALQKCGAGCSALAWGCTR
jgi:hypothetical protein